MKARDLLSYLFPFVEASRKSRISGLLEVVRQEGTLVLNTGGVNYSFGGLHRVFENAFAKIGFDGASISNMLILGMGVGSVMSIVRNDHGCRVPVTGVEADEEVIALGKEFFGLGNFSDLDLVCSDAAAFVQSCERTFDFIVVDLFVGDKVPEKFQSETFVEALSRILSPGGKLLFNKMSHTPAMKDERDRLANLLESVVGPVRQIKMKINGSENTVFYVKKGG